MMVEHCTDRDSFLGQSFDDKNLGDAHMIGGLVPKRAVPSLKECFAIAVGILLAWHVT